MLINWILLYNHPPQVKRAVVTSLIDLALNICSDSYINAEINFIRDIVYDNGYPIPFVKLNLKKDKFFF